MKTGLGRSPAIRSGLQPLSNLMSSSLQQRHCSDTESTNIGSKLFGFMPDLNTGSSDLAFALLQLKPVHT